MDAQAKWKDGGIPELQLGLLNPFAILTDPGSVFGDAISDLFAAALQGEDLPPLQNLLTQDFIRLTVGGNREGSYGLPNLVALTSEYGLTKPVTINWMGQQIVLFPKTGKINGSETPNYVALPKVTLGTPTGLDQIIPTTDFNFSDIKFPGSDILGLLGGLGGGSSLLSGLTNTLGLGGILPLANVDTNTVQNLGTNTVVAKALGVNTTAVAPLAASYGVDGTDAAKLAAADTTNARSTTSSITSKTRDAVKNWQSQTQQQTQTMTTTAKQAATQAFQTPKAATEAWKAQRQQNQEAWQQQKQSWQQGGTNSWDSTPKSNSGEGTSNGFTSRFGSKFFSGNKGTSNPPASDGAQSTTPGPAGSASSATGGTGQ